MSKIYVVYVSRSNTCYQLNIRAYHIINGVFIATNNRMSSIAYKIRESKYIILYKYFLIINCTAAQLGL